MRVDFEQSSLKKGVRVTDRVTFKSSMKAFFERLFDLHTLSIRNNIY